MYQELLVNQQPHLWPQTVRRLVNICDGEETLLGLIYDYALDRLSIQWHDPAHQQPTADDDDNVDFFTILTRHLSCYWNGRWRRVEIFNADDQTTAMGAVQIASRKENPQQVV